MRQFGKVEIPQSAFLAALQASFALTGGTSEQPSGGGRAKTEGLT
jgi:hypothetical protein